MLRSNQMLLGSCFVLALASVMITAVYGQAPGDEDVISGLKGRWKIESGVNQVRPFPPIV